jgi:large subunit ribosomal protein L1
VSERIYSIMKHGKKYTAVRSKIDPRASFPLDQAVKMVKDSAYAKFDETVEVAVRLGVDPKKADQMIRGTVSLPHGTGKQVRVLVLAKGERVQEAKEAGADHVGLEDYIEKIQGGWLECDVIVAAPDVMAAVGKIGKLLGPKGMMPNPKSGTVTPEVGKAVKEIKKGKIAFKVDRTGNVQVPVGKVSFGFDALKENALSFVDMIMRLKPASAKGLYLQNASITSTMGAGVKLDTQDLLAQLRQ